MYSDASLYYLNHLGIRPWIKRESTLVLQENNNIVTSETLKLLVFTSTNLSEKGLALLRQMLAYLHLSESELKVISVTEQGVLATNEVQCAAAILIFGLNKNNFLNDINSNGLIVRSLDPDYLISYPGAKKNVFHDLNLMKQFFKASL
ncbi:MAG: DNA polymerase III subunit psi [Legionella sp.]|uniref:DNA polymerase III subunit psi n=1 Tax=Legionella sp. TaxID=459 RepID=UPI0039E63871